MNHYEAKQEARRQRYEERSENALKRSEAAFDRADLREEKSGIPFGQPILVGHHSEGRHRRAIAKADAAMRRGIDEQSKAAHYADKAESVGLGGISSDDPDAADKLQAKIDKAEADQTMMREANKLVRARIRKTRPIELDAYISAMTDLGISQAHATILLEGDFCGRQGFASYQLSNNNANITRMKNRISQLKHAATAEHKETDYQGVRVVENVEANRLQLIFPGKPSDDIRAELKSRGFRWARSEGAWQRHLNNAGRWAAECVVKMVTAS